MLGHLMFLVTGVTLSAAELPKPPLRGALVMEELANPQFRLEGPIRSRLEANLEQWLLHAPQANPGMLRMFHQRDRQPTPQLVPWAGEFVGKYLISAIQANRMTGDPRLRPQIQWVVDELINSQADDGYLGPFPKKDRLLKNWDLWGHYHAIQALLLWHHQTGHQPSLEAARRAGELVCKTYLDTGRRVLAAGDPEMNMSILTAMAMLYRHTNDPRFWQMAKEVERDWEKAGDYLRSGLDGREFFQSPRPRWESLHSLQGLLELWRITGEQKYRQAFEHHWRSIRRWDRRNTGGFSSGEQATGNPYAPTAIETCCTVAWMALTLDYLKLTGSLQAADELELSTLNGGLGAQHPSGRWWTYSTPMDGVREASAHSIVFQARAGTPELNCCSVNAPRIPGMLSEWAVMSGNSSLILNWLGQGSFTGEWSGRKFTLTSTADAWLDGKTAWHFPRPPAGICRLKIRIPGWAANPRVRLNGREITNVRAGRYLELSKHWTSKDRIELQMDPGWKFIPGANEAAGKVSLYRGAVLLAFDQAFNPFDEEQIPPLDLNGLADSILIKGGGNKSPAWLQLEAPGIDGKKVRLVDFASAGQNGTKYRSWLKSTKPLPAPSMTELPRDGEKIPAGPVRFQWRRGQTGNSNMIHQVEFSATEDFEFFLLQTNVSGQRVMLNPSHWVDEGMPIWWRVNSRIANLPTVAEVPPAFFVVDKSLPAKTYPPDPVLGPGGELVKDALRSTQPLEIGTRDSAKWERQLPDGTEFNGRDQMVVYAVPEWPQENYSVHLGFKIQSMPAGRIAQLFSGWTAGSDDPLRLVVDGGKLFARIEAGAGYTTSGAALTLDRWHQAVAVKERDRLTLFLDGKEVGSVPVPLYIHTRSTACGLAGNPRYSGNEFLQATLRDFLFYADAVRPSALP